MNRMLYLIAGVVIDSLLTGGAAAVSSPRPARQDPLKQGPQYYKVLLENDEVRVLEYRLKPGEKEQLHSHPEGVVYGFNDSKIRVTSADGTVTQSIGKAGDVYWRKALTHALENIGDTEVHSLAFEIKRH